MTNHFSNHDRQMMEAALQEAKLAFAEDEVPVGALLSLDGKIIARAHNQMESRQDPSAHAEMLCIRKAAEVIQNWRLQEMVLYTTLEPCSMCAGAILLSRVKRVVWGAPDKRHGAHGSWVDLFSKKHPTHELEIEGGLCAEESAELMREFFKQKRMKYDKPATTHSAL